MGYPILTAEDFKGEVHISSNQYSISDLEQYISRFEQDILQDLLGCQMESELIADLDGDNYPITEKFQKIWNSFCIDDEPNMHFIWDYGWFYGFHDEYYGYGCHIKWKSRGIKEVLKGMIYFLYSRDYGVKNTVTGNVKQLNNVSENVPLNQTNITRIYNNALDSYVAIQWYIYKNPDSYDYTSFKGVFKDKVGLV